MRKWIIWMLLLGLVFCGGAAYAQSMTDALGITGDGGVSVKGGLSVRTEADLFVVMNNGEEKALVRVPRAGGEPVLVENAAEIEDLVTVDGDLYYLRRQGGETTLIRRHADGSKGEVYSFGTGSARSLSAFGDNLFVMVDDQVHIVYPANGLILKLVAMPMSDYVIAGDFLYYISLTDTMTYETASLISEGTMLEGSAGCLYRLNLTTGNSTLLIKTGVEALKCVDGALYFHNLSDNYVMGGAENEWLAGKLYRYDIASEALTRIVDGYDWGYYPMNAGISIYTSGNISLYAEDGTLTRSLYEPELYAVISGDAEALIAYEPTDAKVTYIYPDGRTADVREGDALFAAPAASTSPWETEFPPLENPEETDAPDANAATSGETTGSWYEGPTATPLPFSSNAIGESSGGATAKPASSPSATAKPASTKAPSYTTSDVGKGKKLTTTASVNLRKGPGTGYAVITSIAKGKTATCKGSAVDSNGNRWYKVTYSGSAAWVYGKYVSVGSASSGGSSSESSTGKGKTIVATGMVNLRKGAGLGYAVLGTAAKGDTFSGKGSAVDSRGVRWYKVSYDGGTAWISSKYSKIGSSSSSGESSTGSGKTIVATGMVNLRKGAGLGYAVLGTAAKGDTFSGKGSAVDSRGVRWYKVSYDGGTAWISSKYSKIK